MKKLLFQLIRGLGGSKIKDNRFEDIIKTKSKEISDDEINRIFKKDLKELDDNEKRVYYYVCRLYFDSKEKLENRQISPEKFNKEIEEKVGRKLLRNSISISNKMKEIIISFYESYWEYYYSTDFRSLLPFFESASHINNNLDSSIIPYFKDKIPTLEDIDPTAKIVLKILLCKLIKYKRSIKRKKLSPDQIKQILYNNIEQEIQEILKIKTPRIKSYINQDSEEALKLRFEQLIGIIIKEYRDYTNH